MLNKEINSPLLRSLLILLVLSAIAALTSYAIANFEEKEGDSLSPATIVVSGEGEVTAVPDVGEFSFSVRAEAREASVAQEESGTKVNTILAYLKKQEVEDRDIKTVSYNLSPRYHYERPDCPAGAYCPAGKQVQDGFLVNQTIRVKVRDLDKASTVISKVGDLGATDISGLNFTIDDTDELVREARQKAIADAKEKATELANQLGVDLDRIIGFSENNYYPRPYYEAKSLAMPVNEDVAFGGAELPTGENVTKVNVSITFAIE